jgi:hypothetical protein
MRNGQTLSGYAVRLVGWQKDAVFTCDGSKKLDADNWSPYHDNRDIDSLTGERLDGTGSVHPDVLSGEKQVGDDGRWGNINELYRLNQAYLVAAHEQAAAEVGDTVIPTYNADGTIDLEIQCVG